MPGSDLRRRPAKYAGLLGLFLLAGCVRLGFGPTELDDKDVDGSVTLDLSPGEVSLADLGTDGPLADLGTDGPPADLDTDGPPADLGTDGPPADLTGSDGTQGILTPVTSASSSLTGTGQAVVRVGTMACLGISDVDKGMEVFDLAQPASPKSLGVLRTDSGAAMLSSWANDVLSVHVAAGRAYLTTYYGGLVVADLSSSGPVFVGSLKLSSEAWAVQVSGSHAYIANYGSGLAVVDVTVPSKPSLTLQLPLSGKPHDLQLVGNTLYTAAQTRFHAVDISSPGKPVLLGDLDITTADSTGTIYEVWSDGSYAFVISNKGRRLLVIDVTNPKAPAVVWTGPAGAQELRAVEGHGGLLYVGTGSISAGSPGSVQVYDISKPLAPKLLDEHVLGATVYELSATTCGVTAATADGKLRVFSVKPCP